MSMAVLLMLALLGGGEDLVCAWVFDEGGLDGNRVVDQAGRCDAVVHGPLNVTCEGLYLDSAFNSITVLEGKPPAYLPRQGITVEAWLSMDEIKEWGGIAGFIQDNGGFEKGWLLGARGDRFTFALSSEGADDGDGSLTYLNAKSVFKPGWWYHVVGTYDGGAQRIYVNGALENESTVQSGDLLYPDRSFFDIAAYHDENEHYRWSGTLHAVRLFNRAFIGEEIKARYEAGRGAFPTHGPEGVDLAGPLAPADVAALTARPFPEDRAVTKEAERIVALSGARKGYCLILGCREGKLAFELARLTEMRIIVVEPDAAKVEAARRALDTAGAYGTRISVRQGSLDRLPFPDGFANVVVGTVSIHHDEVFRVLRPCGGTAVQGDDVVRKGPLEGAGQWTHMYADSANTACSGDALVKGDLSLQWFGRPGPRLMIDRHHRNVPPLYKNGRLFVPADERIIAVDAYNGTWLWDLHVPGSRRLGVFLDTSNMVVDEERLYLVRGTGCSAIDVVTGKPDRTIPMPQLIEDVESHWGFVAREGDLLLGTGRIPAASYTETSYAADSALWYDNMAIVTSRYFFALDVHSGEVKWSYLSGLLLNPTLTVGGDRVYFVETNSPHALANDLGRMPGGTFLEGDANFLVALDLQTGEVIYRNKVDLTNCRLIAYLNYADEVLLLSGGEYVENKLWYYFYGMDAATGRERWHRSHDSGYDPGGGHGEQNRHPTVVGKTVYTYPYAYDLKSGEPVEGYAFSRDGHGCGGVSASAHALFWRGGNPTMRDVRNHGSSRKINHVSRPGCWINIIPAGGLVLIPEASSGCTCAFPLQTSLAYRPVAEE